MQHSEVRSSDSNSVLHRKYTKAISPIAATSLDDFKLDENVYKPDFELTERFQGFSKELVRMSLLGLGIYGFLIKLAAEQGGDKYLEALRIHKILATLGVAAFAISAACALLNGYFATQCLAHQLIISRYFARLAGDRYDKEAKETFRIVIQKQQKTQRRVVEVGKGLLLAATISLISGAILVAFCSGLVLFRK